MRKKEKAKQILDSGGICQIEKDTYLVQSQSRNRKYIVKDHVFQMSCTCPYFEYRGDSCKHIISVQLLLKNHPTKIKQHTHKVEIELKCSHCDSDSFVKDGKRKTASGRKQKYLCRECGGRFTEDFIKRIKGNSEFLTEALDLYFRGVSFRSLQEHFRQIRSFEVHASTLYRWIRRFCKIMIKYAERMYPEVSGTWNADEQMIKARGKWKWCWNLIDKETRFLIATNVTIGRDINDARRLFRKSKKIVKGKPQFVITDGLLAYRKAIKKEFHSHRLPRVTHVSDAGVSKLVNNNRIERFHNTFRSRDRTMRGFHNMRTAGAFVTAHRLFYNFVRSHSALGGLTPAQAAGIDIGFNSNRWEELLQAAITSSNSRNYRRQPKRIKGYSLRVWDQQGKPLSKFQMRQFKTEFDSRSKAKEFLQFYESMFPRFVFFIKEKKSR